MTQSGESLNWRQKSLLASSFVDNSADLLERHLMLYNGADRGNVGQSDIHPRMQSVCTDFDLKFPNIDSIVGTDINGAEAIFVNYAKASDVTNHRAVAQNSASEFFANTRADTGINTPNGFPKKDSTTGQVGFYSARELLAINAMKVEE